jgi:hypothetical protein
MGPSILAAGFTTIAAATIMLFTVISFFVKFAVILFATVVQATVGSFIVFVALADAFGPSRPTYVFDWISAKLTGKEDTEGDRTIKDTEQISEETGSPRYEDYANTEHISEEAGLPRSEDYAVGQRVEI